MAVGSTEKLYFNFVGGLNTEGSHLNNPENTADVLENFILKQNGKLVKRAGLSEEGVWIAPPQSTLTTPTISVNKWFSLVKGQKADFFVVQVAATLSVISVAGTVITTIGTISLTPHKRPTSLTVGEQSITAASGKGYLYVASPEIYPFYLIYNPDLNVISSTSINIYIRDFYGREDGLNPSEKPATLTADHEYNLFNQGWDNKYIQEYKNNTGLYPSNAQVWYYGRREIPDDDEPFLAFRPAELDAQYFGNSAAPKGHFILNVLDGSLESSPGEQFYLVEEIDSVYLVTVYENRSDYSKVKWRRQNRLQNVLVGDKLGPKDGSYYGIVSEIGVEGGETYAIVEAAKGIPTQFGAGSRVDLFLYRDASFSGDGNYSLFSQPTIPSITAFYSGRSWFAGATSREWSNAIFFSQLQDDERKIGKCYQDADPTSEHISDLIATDGGVLFVDSAVQIVAMVPYSSSLVIFASNGVWELSGAAESGFKATEFRIIKISDFGCAGKDSVIATGDGFLYWSESGIYVLSREQISGSLQASSITQTTIQSWYSTLTLQQKENARGLFDETDKIVYWMYSSSPTTDTPDDKNSFDRVLVFDTKMPAFYTLTFPWEATPITGRVVGMLPTSSNNVVEFTYPQVVVGADTVVVGAYNVVVSEAQVTSAPALSERIGFLVSMLSGVYVHTLTSDTYYDFGRLEYDAKIQTRYDLDGDALRKKQMRYIQTHFLKETVTGRLTGAGVCAPPSGWFEVAPIPVAVVQAHGVVMGDYFYVFGGYNQLSTVQRYNRLTNTWTQPTTLPQGGRHELCAGHLPNGQIFVAGGFGGVLTADAHWYDPFSNTWTTKNNLPFPWLDARMSRLPDGRMLYSGGSRTGYPETRTPETYIYDSSTDSYTITDPLNFPVGNHVLASMADGRVISTAGALSSGALSPHTEIFDPVSMTWTEVSPCPEALGEYSGIAATVCGPVYVWGGIVSGVTHKKIYSYDPATDTWTKLPDLSFFASQGVYGQFYDGQYIWASGKDNVGATTKVYLSGGA